MSITNVLSNNIDFSPRKKKCLAIWRKEMPGNLIYYGIWTALASSFRSDSSRWRSASNIVMNISLSNWHDGIYQGILCSSFFPNRYRHLRNFACLILLALFSSSKTIVRTVFFNIWIRRLRGRLCVNRNVFCWLMLFAGIIVGRSLTRRIFLMKSKCSFKVSPRGNWRLCLSFLLKALKHLSLKQT